MIRLLIRMAVFFAAGAIGLLVAAAVFDGFELSTLGFVVDAAIFGVVLGLLDPLTGREARRGGSTLIGLVVKFVTVFAALLVTDLLSDDLTIDGIDTWIGATAVVWVATVLAGFLIRVLIVKRFVDERHR